VSTIHQLQLDDLNVCAAFLAVAEERSFTRAAKRVGVSRSALSHAVRGLEERIGVRLLARTTRSVAPTDAGEQLIGRLRPALGDVASVLDQIAEQRERPAGRVRLVVSPLAAAMVVAPKLGAFARAYPNVVLDVTTTNEMHLDLVAGHFDADWPRAMDWHGHAAGLGADPSEQFLMQPFTFRCPVRQHVERDEGVDHGWLPWRLADFAS
jgi:DNA-binding transcriptional LysR family regulator